VVKRPSPTCCIEHDTADVVPLLTVPPQNGRWTGCATRRSPHCCLLTSAWSECSEGDLRHVVSCLEMKDDKVDW